MRILGVAALAAALATSAAAQQVLYKWTDAQGRVQYSDRVPKDYKGPVQRIDTDPPNTPAPAAQPVPAAPVHAAPKAAEAKPAPAPQDTATKRRTTRERLQGDIDAAQARLDAAKKELAAVNGPNDDERQVIQQYPANNPGSLPASQRSNCMTVADANGKPAVRCAALIPSPAYYERIQALELKVKEAEDSLSEAQNAYRRGVD
jgi:hypothetical protein